MIIQNMIIFVIDIGSFKNNKNIKTEIEQLAKEVANHTMIERPKTTARSMTRDDDDDDEIEYWSDVCSRVNYHDRSLVLLRPSSQAAKTNPYVINTIHSFSDRPETSNKRKQNKTKKGNRLASRSTCTRTASTRSRRRPRRIVSASRTICAISPKNATTFRLDG